MGRSLPYSSKVYPSPQPSAGYVTLQVVECGAFGAEIRGRVLTPSCNSLDLLCYLVWVLVLVRWRQLATVLADPAMVAARMKEAGLEGL